MKSWYRTIREDELKDGSVRKVYHLVFETDDKSIVEKIEQFFYDVMDAKTEPTISKMEQVDKDINVRSKDEPKTQMKTQNSNLTFEKAECAKEYEELGLKELKELIEADRKTENSSEKPNNSKVSEKPTGSERSE